MLVVQSVVGVFSEAFFPYLWFGIVLGLLLFLQVLGLCLVGCLLRSCSFLTLVCSLTKLGDTALKCSCDGGIDCV